MNKQLEGQFTKAFKTKVDQLNAFIKPAFEDNKIRSQIVEHGKSWAHNITKSVRDHYQKRIDEVYDEIQKLEMPEHVKRTVIDKAIYRAKKNFGRKLAHETVGEFTNYFKSTPEPKTRQPEVNSIPIQYVKGHHVTLSNFKFAPFMYRGVKFNTVEHALQYNKALFFDDYDLSERVLNTQKPFQVMFFSNKWPNTLDWQRSSIALMKEILAAKFEQVMDFRDALLKCAGSDIVFNINDLFWGSGKTGSGSNHYGKCLKSVLTTKTSDVISEDNTVKKSYTQALLTVKPKQIIDLKSSLDTSDDKNVERNDTENTPRRSQRIANRDNQSARTPTVATVKKTLSYVDLPAKQGSKFCHTRAKDKFKDWVLPAIRYETLILGDSNLDRVDRVPPNTQIESFPGARIKHIKKLIERYPNTGFQPKRILLSVGINDKQSESETVERDCSELVNAIQKKFPKCEIAYGELNYCKNLPYKYQETIIALNKYIRSHPGITNVPPIDGRKFYVNNDMIHWTRKTADALITWWLDRLNW